VQVEVNDINFILLHGSKQNSVTDILAGNIQSNHIYCIIHWHPGRKHSKQSHILHYTCLPASTTTKYKEHYTKFRCNV